MPKLLRSAPYLPVADVAKTAAYYRDVFGFDDEYFGGVPPVFAICSRDDARFTNRRRKPFSPKQFPGLRSPVFLL